MNSADLLLAQRYCCSTPVTITKDGKTIRHTYDGSGARLRTERPDGSVTNYAGPLVQDEDGTYIQFADGRILLDKSQPSPTDDPVLRYQYKIQDHPRHGVGAPCKPTVVTFEDIDGDGQIIGAEVLQRELYYPATKSWGRGPSCESPLDNFYTKPGAPLTPEQPFLYNGKAYETAQDLNWYFSRHGVGAHVSSAGTIRAWGGSWALTRWRATLLLGLLIITPLITQYDLSTLTVEHLHSLMIGI